MTSDRAQQRSVKLYMKADCHLCEEAEATLDDLRPRFAHALERIDITTDPALLRRYGELIPVLVVDGREYRAPLSLPTIEQALTGTGAAHSDGGPRATSATQRQDPGRRTTSSKTATDNTLRSYLWSRLRGR